MHFQVYGLFLDWDGFDVSESWQFEASSQEEAALLAESRLQAALQGGYYQWGDATAPQRIEMCAGVASPRLRAEVSNPCAEDLTIEFRWWGRTTVSPVTCWQDTYWVGLREFPAHLPFQGNCP
jgi:hypothetical protein